MRVLITRHKVDAAKTAESLKEQGHEPVLLPLFEVADTGNADPSTDFDGYIFTSGNAVSVLDGRGWRCSGNNAVAFCVGNKTAEE
ncbi:MAG: uroporphyrinogen-III synthase, partial [Pseudomonadota bacterium]